MLEAIKLAALDVMDKGNLADICYGVVTREMPLQIMIEQKIELTERFLILTRAVTDYQAKVKLQRVGEENRDYQATIYNGLKVGDKVVLMKAAGGQQYVVLERVAGEGVTSDSKK